jgi:hypothetical protein
MNTEPLLPLRRINSDEHDKLLRKIDSLPLRGTEALIYQKSVEELYAKYTEQVQDLAGTITCYREIMELIKKRQPLTNKKKYLQVRRRQHV